MKLAEVKQRLGIEQLNLNTAKDRDGNTTPWMRHWDNEARVAVSIHKDTVAAIKADPSAVLGLQKEIRTADKGDYTAYRIVKYTAPEETL